VKQHTKLWLMGFSLLVVGSGGAQAAMAGGFAISEQSASSAGSAVAGAVVVARDASTVFYNPAGMTRLLAPEIVGAIGFVVPSLRFHNRGTRDATGALVNGNQTIDNDLFAVPSLFLTVPVSGQLTFGFGLNAPFGESVSYNRGWVGRYSAVEASLTTANLNPAVAYRVTDWLSLGVGFNAQYAQLEG
jgi:long-chain fatty acid transport protein